MFSFAGKNALIVWAGRNIGRAIALEFARRGARVAVADINKSGADETAQEVARAGGEATGVAIDVTSEASVIAAVAEAERFLGQIDIHMNNAGVLRSGNAEDIPLAIVETHGPGAVHSERRALCAALSRSRKEPRDRRGSRSRLDCIMEIWWNSRADFEASQRLIASADRLTSIKEDEKKLFAGHANPVCSVIEYDSQWARTERRPAFR